MMNKYIEYIMELIIVDDIAISIKRELHESREQFYERVWIVANNYKIYENNIERLICLTKIWSNIKYLRCKYRDTILNEVKTLKTFV